MRNYDAQGRDSTPFAHHGPFRRPGRHPCGSDVRPPTIDHRCKRRAPTRPPTVSGSTQGPCTWRYKRGRDTTGESTSATRPTPCPSAVLPSPGASPSSVGPCPRPLSFRSYIDTRSLNPLKSRERGKVLTTDESPKIFQPGKVGESCLLGSLESSHPVGRSRGVGWGGRGVSGGRGRESTRVFGPEEEGWGTMGSREFLSSLKRWSQVRPSLM